MASVKEMSAMLPKPAVDASYLSPGSTAWLKPQKPARTGTLLPKESLFTDFGPSAENLCRLVEAAEVAAYPASSLSKGDFCPALPGLWRDQASRLATKLPGNRRTVEVACSLVRWPLFLNHGYRTIPKLRYTYYPLAQRIRQSRRYC
jgi:hypothetical protein